MGRASWARRLERTIRASADAAATWLPVAFFIAVSPGVLAWGLRSPDDLSTHFASNRLVLEDRIELLTRAGASLLVVGALYAAVAWRAAVRDGFWSAQPVRELNRRLAFFLSFPFLMAFAVAGIEARHPFLTLLMTVLAAMPAGVSAAAVAPSAAAAWRRLAGTSAWKRGAGLGALVPPLIVMVLAIVYAKEAIELHLAQFIGFRSGAHDLGIYTNILWQSLEGNFLGCSFCKGGTHAGAHYDPILVLLSPAMLLHRGAETLIVLQSVWLASAALPVYLLGTRSGGRLFGVAFAVVYLAHPAMQGVNLFDFHSMSLSLPFVLWAAYFLERQAWKRYTATIALLLLCREDMAIAASCLGFYAIVARRQVRAGAVTIAVSACWLAFVKLVAMPDPALLMENSEQAYEYGSYFRALNPQGGGVAGILSSLLTNPPFLVKHLFAEARVLYVLQLLVPLMFLPVLAGRGWVLMGYGMIFILLSSREAVYTLGFHYASTALPALFILAAALCERIAQRLQRSRGIAPRQTLAFLGASMLVASLCASVAFGGIVDNESFKAGWYPLVREVTPARRERYETFAEMTSRIPADAPVTAGAFVLPHLATRSHVKHFPVVEGSEWIVVGTRDLRAHERTALARFRRDDGWQIVDERAGFVIFRRAGDEASPP